MEVHIIIGSKKGCVCVQEYTLYSTYIRICGKGTPGDKHACGCLFVSDCTSPILQAAV